MTKKPAYEELEQRVKELEKESVESKLIEKSLRNSEEQYRLLVENSYDIPYSVTPDGIITFIGSQIKRFGYTPEDVIPKHYLEFVVPEQRQEVMHNFEKGTKNKTSYPTEFQWQGKDGRLHWVEAVGQIICDNSGHPISQIGVMRDITDRKQADMALRESEEKYRTILESIEEAYFEVDIAGNFIFFNDSLSKSLGYSNDELMGMNNRDYMSPEASKKIYNLFNQIYRTGNPKKRDLRNY